MPRIIQLTDLHLTADPAARLKNVPTWETFRDVLTHVRENAGDWDLLVITGDLAQDERAETYERLRAELGDWLPRCRLVPGNHDNRAGLRQVFPEMFSNRSEFLIFREAVGEWRILGLDTQSPGEVGGRIGPDQLEWLARQLEENGDSPTLVFLHHPPVSVNSAWLDKIGLEAPEPFRELIATHPQVRAVATGHVHHVFEGKLGRSAVLTTPSTAIQFEPGGESATYINDPPGYRVFDLEDTGYRTQVVRLPVLRFPPLPD